MLILICFNSSNVIINIRSLSIDIIIKLVYCTLIKSVGSEGKPFKAKPHGDRAQKYWYVDNFEDECLNHYANVKYFYMSDENVPLQPSVSSIRIKEDMPNE